LANHNDTKKAIGSNNSKPINLKAESRKALLTTIDKKILEVLLNPDGKITTYALAKKIGVPATTVQRRRAYLEERFLDLNYTLKLDELGYRRVDLLIGTQGGQATKVAEQLLKLEPIVYVGASVGQQTIDLRAEAVIKDNSELLDLLELTKGMEGTRDVVWSEIVRVIGRKKSVPSDVIDQL
jgi:DNA-binding Lrp family transcriptional regulator